MATIAFSHHKGGTGKTTSCLNIAGFSEKSGKRVLVVDCDPQANATTGLGVSPDSCRQNIYDIFMSRVEGFPQVTMKDIIVKTSSGIDLAPSNLDLVGAEPYLYQLNSRASVLKEALDPVKDTYDLILIDTPPSMGQFVINGLFAADHIIVTLDSGSFALNGITTLTTIFNDMRQDLAKDIHMDMAIISRWNEAGMPEPKDPQTETTDFFTRLKSLFVGTPVPSPEEVLAKIKQEQEHERQSVILSDIRSRFSAVYTVPYSPEIYNAQKRGMPISHVAPACSAGQAYRIITDEVLKWK
jgi:chromosome partitioning protein